MLRQSHLLEVAKDPNEMLTSSQWIVETATDDMVLMECDEETMLFLVWVASEIIHHESLVLSSSSFCQSDFSLLNLKQEDFSRQGAGWE